MRWRSVPPWALTALLGLVYLLATPATTDLAAQEHRIALARDGVWLYDLSWFGGHHLPSYSVLLPLFGSWIGGTLVGALSAVVAAWAFRRLAGRRWPGTAGLVASWWFAAGIGGLLFTGRLTFVLGMAFGLLTLVAAVGRGPGNRSSAGAEPAPTSAPVAVDHLLRRSLLGALGAVATALASPVAALFLAMVAAAWLLAASGRRARIVPLVVAGIAFVTAGVLSLAFPGGGSEPFVASALWPAVAAMAVAVVVLPRDERTLRVGVAIYLAAIVLSGLLDTPMGGNATRLGALVGGPLLAGALWGRRPLALALLALPFLYWQWYPPVRDAVQAYGDPSARASYWRPLADQLRVRLIASPSRVEVPPTARRGEVRWLPPEVPLARGWIRQLDRDRSALFYDGRPSVAAYVAWLRENAVGWVALPDAPTDYASRAEIELLRSGRVPGLRRVWRDAHISLWRFEGARPLATWASGPGDTTTAADGGDATRRDSDDGRAPRTDGRAADATPRVTVLEPERVVLEVPRAGAVDLRIRWSPYLRITAGAACLRRGSGGWTHVTTSLPGTVTVGTGFAVPWRHPESATCNT